MGGRSVGDGGGVRRGDGVAAAVWPQEVEHAVEVALEDDADTLCRRRRAYVVVAVVEAVIGLETYGARAVEEVLKVEVADELCVVERFVAVSEVAVE